MIYEKKEIKTSSIFLIKLFFFFLIKRFLLRLTDKYATSQQILVSLVEKLQERLENNVVGEVLMD